MSSIQTFNSLLEWQSAWQAISPTCPDSVRCYSRTLSLESWKPLGSWLVLLILIVLFQPVLQSYFYPKIGPLECGSAFTFQACMTMIAVHFEMVNLLCSNCCIYTSADPFSIFTNNMQPAFLKRCIPVRSKLSYWTLLILILTVCGPNLILFIMFFMFLFGITLCWSFLSLLYSKKVH